jgi:tRNA 2-thiouridine synthesizing protein A
MTSGMTGGSRPDPVVDAVGLRCPLPVIRLAAAVRDLLDAGAPGTTHVVVRSTDPAAGPDIAAWCRMRGHELAGQLREGEVLVSTVLIRPPGSRTPPAAAG